MSESALCDTKRRAERYWGAAEFPGGWTVAVYSIAADGVAPASLQEARAAIAGVLADIEGRMSAEFEYGRFGVVIVHTGNRGTCVTVTHFGMWGSTFEIFMTAWYRYGRGFTGLCLLDDVEPSLCWFEVPRVVAEIHRACDLAANRDLEAVRREYLRCAKEQSGS